ncbi:hypothetical protein NC652_039096 [Populus alba x Populus x berolinensis]|nr:hypothetical protein NC652_039096 [Populus alba x Populus x berolinensis]
MKIHHQGSIFKPPITSSSSPSPLFQSQKTHDDSPLPLPLRVADILLFDDKDDDVLDELLMMGGEGRCRGWQRSSSCYPPHRIAARWISGLRRSKVKESNKDELGGDGIVQVRRSMKGLNEQDSRNSASEITVSEQCNREATVNLGVGCCLLHLIAASKNELDKMLEMRMQMEKLLDNVREELRKKDGLSKPSNVCAYSTTHIVDGPDFETQLSPQIFTSSYVLPGSSAITVCDHSLRWETPMQEECSEGMDKLEAELEVELERLQLHLDTVDNSVKCPQKKGRWVTNEDIATSKSQTGSSGEVVAFVFEDQAAGSEEHRGVPPRELEQRLHELLESRQQEHIRELEAKLECLEHKLREKEMEVSWWKDTARLISRHLPGSSKFSSHHLAKLLTRGYCLLSVWLPRKFTETKRTRDPNSKLLKSGPFTFVISEEMAFLHVLILVILSLNRYKNNKAMAEGSSGSEFTLDSIRKSLIRQEDTIVFCLMERARFPMNSALYNQSLDLVPGFSGPLVDFIVQETEAVQAKAGRYVNPEENPFFPDNLPPSLVPNSNYSQVLHPGGASININKAIWDMYLNQLLPLFVVAGDDGNYASTAASDLSCLQALSRRIHYGKFVAEIKFRDAPHDYEPPIRAKDADELMKLLTDERVEKMVKKRVEKKAIVFGQDVSGSNNTDSKHYKVDPSVVARLYDEWVIPLTKRVEVEYLIRRLN